MNILKYLAGVGNALEKRNAFLEKALKAEKEICDERYITIKYLNLRSSDLDSQQQALRHELETARVAVKVTGDTIRELTASLKDAEAAYNDQVVRKLACLTEITVLTSDLAEAKRCETWWYNEAAKEQREVSRLRSELAKEKSNV
jgi:hypothetical protein